jgi:hypothetical protein
MYLDKTLATSDWAAEWLTPEQIVYAATDAWITRELYLKLSMQEVTFLKQEQYIWEGHFSVAIVFYACIAASCSKRIHGCGNQQYGLFSLPFSNANCCPTSLFSDSPMYSGTSCCARVNICSVHHISIF